MSISSIAKIFKSLNPSKLRDSIKEGLTFDDVLLVPKKTPLSSRREADLSTRFTKNVFLKNPLVSSNMATVTESEMAIAMAREGGLGILHQFCTIDEQVEQVKKVKRSTSYVLEKPITISPSRTLEDALRLMKKEKITSLLVEQDGLKGILTSRDYFFEKDKSKKISELMTEKVITAPPNISLDNAEKLLHKHRIEKLPLVENGRIRGMITAQDIKKLTMWPHANRDEKGRLLVGGAVGVKDTLERTQALINAGIDVLVLDIAHAHSNIMLKRVREIKENFDIDIMVGNIGTKNAAEDLINAGADGLKVGIGPSPICSTRIMSGSGIPQLTATLDVCSVANKHDVPVSADGGMKYPGDVVKALAAGASTIYSGFIFAGTKEAPGLIINQKGKRYKQYAGSASYESSHVRKERIEGEKIKEKLDVYEEGISTLVDYKGPVHDVILGFVKGIQSGISYCGAKNIKEMQQNSEFMKITQNARFESLARGMEGK